MPFHARTALVAGIALIAAGCAELQWQKPGATEAMLEQDLRQCQAEARIRASRFAPFSSDWPRFAGVDSLGRRLNAPIDRLDSDRFLIEQDYTRSCMTAKGYQLAPVATR